MGLFEKLKSFGQEEAARRVAVEKQLIIDHELNKATDRQLELQRMQEAAKEHRKRFVPIKDLLDESGAREHLEAIRRYWKNLGQIDTDPKERGGGEPLYRLGLYEDYVRGTGLELNLQHEFTAKFVRNTPLSDGSGDYLKTVYETVDESMLLKLSVTAYIPEGTDQHNIRASYIAKYKKSHNHYGFEGLAIPTFQYPAELGIHCWREFPPESLDSNTLSFPPSNRKDSKNLLEDLLFGLVKEIDIAEASPVHLSKYRVRPAQAWYRKFGVR